MSGLHHFYLEIGLELVLFGHSFLSVFQNVIKASLAISWTQINFGCEIELWIFNGSILLQGRRGSWLSCGHKTTLIYTAVHWSLHKNFQRRLVDLGRWRAGSKLILLPDSWAMLFFLLPSVFILNLVFEEFVWGANLSALRIDCLVCQLFRLRLFLTNSLVFDLDFFGLLLDGVNHESLNDWGFRCILVVLGLAVEPDEILAFAHLSIS